MQDALETLLNQGQHAWVPYISTWSIKTLGVLSKKYKRSDNRGEYDHYIVINEEPKRKQTKHFSTSITIEIIMQLYKLLYVMMVAGFLI